MAIPINGINNGHSVGSRGRSVEKSNSTESGIRQNIDKPGTGLNAIRSDSVSLSSQAQQLKKIEQDLKTQPNINKTRVAQIKSQLANGTYQIDNAKLAQNMLNLEKSLF